MFRFHAPRDIITLFHKPSSAASTRVLTLLKQASAQASENATEDQASDHSAQNKTQRSDFDLDVTEEAPTSDQLRTILEYVGGKNAGRLVEGAKDVEDALRLRDTGFKRPVVVDWHNGKAVIGESESEILKMLASLPKHDE